MDATIYQSVDRFSGINNVDPATRLNPIVVDQKYVYPLQQANNVEIDNTYELSSRCGYTSVKTGTDIHSMWSDGNTWLYADGSILYEIDINYAVRSLRSDLILGTISYAPFNDRIYYTNEYQIGYIKGNADNALPAPGREFKEPLPAGQLIEYFMGCLYVAKDNILYISDPLCDYYDVRTGYRIFKGRITLLRAVDEGLYVSDDKVWFIKGKGNEDFIRDEAYPVRAIPHTDVKIAGKYIDDSMTGNVAMWTGENGICLGDNTGNVINLTDARYTFTARGNGTGFIREISNKRHYINSLY
jgi:hypothetical protein